MGLETLPGLMDGRQERSGKRRRERRQSYLSIGLAETARGRSILGRCSRGANFILQSADHVHGCSVTLLGLIHWSEIRSEPVGPVDYSKRRSPDVRTEFPFFLAQYEFQRGWSVIN